MKENIKNELPAEINEKLYKRYKESFFGTFGKEYAEKLLNSEKEDMIIKGIYNALKYLELELSWDILCEEPYIAITDAYDWLENKMKKTEIN